MTRGPCPCEGHTLDRLLQPTVMALLGESPMHGYSLVKRLQDSPMMRGGRPDRTGIYRLLGAMEKQGLLAHEVCSSQVGPSKRVYVLTDLGWQCLGTWINTLDNYQRAIGDLVDMLRSSSASKDFHSC